MAPVAQQHKRLAFRDKGRSRLTGTVSGFPFLGWDSGKRQTLLLIHYCSKLRSGKELLSGLLFLCASSFFSFGIWMSRRRRRHSGESVEASLGNTTPGAGATVACESLTCRVDKVSVGALHSKLVFLNQKEEFLFDEETPVLGNPVFLRARRSENVLVPVWSTRCPSDWVWWTPNCCRGLRSPPLHWPKHWFVISVVIWHNSKYVLFRFSPQLMECIMFNTKKAIRHNDKTNTQCILGSFIVPLFQSLLDNCRWTLHTSLGLYT